MSRLWVVHEDTIIWGAFTQRKDAYAFRKREFRGPIIPKVSPMPVYSSLSEAPTTNGDDLKEALSL